MHWKGFQRPRRIEVEGNTLTPTYGKFTAQPFERGFATTVGNAMRRCLLSSIEGAAVTAVQIEGVLHEFSSIPGVVEDVTDIILNLKGVPMVMHSSEPRVLTLEADGPGEITAAQLGVDPQVEIIDPDVVIATLNKEAKLRMQVRVGLGRGYVSAERNFEEGMGIGWVPIDSVHSPVKRCNFRVEAARLGRATDYERLVIEVWSNGTTEPADALSLASNLLREHLTIFVESEISLSDHADPEGHEEMSALDALLAQNIDELDLSVRSANCLKNADIHTLRDLVRRSEKDMLETKNFGRKSLEEVQEILDRLGLRFGMDIPESVDSVAVQA